VNKKALHGFSEHICKLIVGFDKVSDDFCREHFLSQNDNQFLCVHLWKTRFDSMWLPTSLSH